MSGDEPPRGLNCPPRVGRLNLSGILPVFDVTLQADIQLLDILKIGEMEIFGFQDGEKTLL